MAKVKTSEAKHKTRSGAEIDPQVADALASEAERGYDLSKARRSRVGRPSLGRRGASPRVSFRTTPELYRAAKRRAREEGRTVSDLAREAVARYIDSQALAGIEPWASYHKAPPDELIPVFEPERVNVVVCGGETNGQISIYMGSAMRGKFRNGPGPTVSVDAWR